MTRYEVLLILEGRRQVGISERELVANAVGSRRTPTQFQRLRRMGLVTRYRAPEGNRQVWRYLITDAGLQRLRWYRENRPEEIAAAERAISR